MINLDFLKNLTLGRCQTSGIMRVYPIIGNALSSDLASFSDIKFLGTTNYGVMAFENTSDKPFIIPAGYAIVTKQEAQDHAIPIASFIEGNVEKRFENACCIQQTQPGYIVGSKIKETFTLLPISIRRSEFYNIDKNSSLNFSRLWPHISKFQKNLVLNKMGDLVLFFNRYMDRLNTFTAEFEPVEGQIGAVIMINDEIIGVEITPNHEYFLNIWDGLIRGAYGAEVLSRTLKNPIENFKKDSLLNLDEVKDIDDILNAVHDSRVKKSLNTKNVLSELSERKVVLIDETDFGGFTQQFFKIGNSVGENFVNQNGEIVYASILI